MIKSQPMGKPVSPPAMGGQPNPRMIKNIRPWQAVPPPMGPKPAPMPAGGGAQPITPYRPPMGGQPVQPPSNPQMPQNPQAMGMGRYNPNAQVNPMGLGPGTVTGPTSFQRAGVAGRDDFGNPSPPSDPRMRPPSPDEMNRINDMYRGMGVDPNTMGPGPFNGKFGTLPPQHPPMGPPHPGFPGPSGGIYNNPNQGAPGGGSVGLGPTDNTPGQDGGGMGGQQPHPWMSAFTGGNMLGQMGGTGQMGIGAMGGGFKALPPRLQNQVNNGTMSLDGAMNRYNLFRGGELPGQLYNRLGAGGSGGMGMGGGMAYGGGTGQGIAQPYQMPNNGMFLNNNPLTGL